MRFLLSKKHVYCLVVLLAALIPVSFPQAQSSAPPIVYQQARMEILIAASTPPAASPTSQTATSPEVPTPPIDTKNKYEAHSLAINVTVRPSEALEQRDLFLLSPFNQADALMFVYRTPELIIPSAPFIQQPVDILTINRQGLIEEILPNIVPANLDSQAAVDSPVLAVMYLKAGTVDKENIKPKDRVKHTIFSPAPEIRQ